jgi:hypothetical protein
MSAWLACASVSTLALLGGCGSDGDSAAGTPPPTPPKTTAADFWISGTSYAGIGQYDTLQVIDPDHPATPRLSPSARQPTSWTG